MEFKPVILEADTDGGSVAFVDSSAILFKDFYADEEFTVVQAFKAGSLVLFDVGGDGGVAAKLTMTPLTGDQLRCTCDDRLEFRLRVNEDEFFFCGAEYVPSKASPLQKEEGTLVKIPPGNYRLTVYGVFLPEERPKKVSDALDEDIDYVFYLEPVTDISNVRFPTSIPWLSPE